MTTGSESAQDTASHADTASEGERVAVLIRLTPETHREMRRAMAELDIRTNQEFGEIAIAEKIARAFGKRIGDRRKGERRAA